MSLKKLPKKSLLPSPMVNDDAAAERLPKKPRRLARPEKEAKRRRQRRHEKHENPPRNPSDELDDVDENPRKPLERLSAVVPAALLTNDRERVKPLPLVSWPFLGVVVNLVLLFDESKSVSKRNIS